MPTFKVTTDDGDETEIDAEYHVTDDGGDFFIFKSADHKQLATFNARRVLSVIRVKDAPVTVGHVTIKVSPQIDPDEWRATVRQAAKRAGGGISLA